GLNTPQPRAEHVANAAEARHHLIRDQQYAVTVADLAHERPVVRWRHDHTTRTLDRLGDERPHGVPALEDGLRPERGGRDSPELFGILRIRVAIQPGGVDVEASREQRLVGATEGRIAVHAGAAEMRAVVALAE